MTESSNGLTEAVWVEYLEIFLLAVFPADLDTFVQELEVGLDRCSVREQRYMCGPRIDSR